VAVVSVMLANNEVGTVQPLAEVAEVVRHRAPGALVHTDAVAAASFLDVASLSRGADLVSVSAHKLGGPKGVGALVVRAGSRLAPQLHGGSQERGMRPGTPGVAGIVGMAVALELATRTRTEAAAQVERLRDRLADGLTSTVPGLIETGVPRDAAGRSDRSRKVVSNCHVCVDGVDQEELLVLLDDAGVCASGGSSCASGALEPSHVLLAMGLSTREARSAVRFSLGRTTTGADVDRVLEVMPKAVEQLRS